jgi:tight adherence protein B
VKRLLPLVAAILAAGVVAGSAGAAVSSGLRVTPAAGAKFPVKTFVLSLPNERRLTPGDVKVTENGRGVAEAKLVPASQASDQTFGVVLLIDTSWSMRGKPLAAAFNAARAFAARRNPNEQLGVIEFNRTAKTVQTLTTSKGAISSALASLPHPTTGTHIFDAVAQAEAMLRSANISSGSIVVLSDGADTGSTATIDQVAHAANAAHLGIYTIGLNDSSYKPGTLKALAAAGNGQYAQATESGLARLFDKLSRLLSNQYVLQYKSLVGPDVPVQVAIDVKGLGTVVKPYRTPLLPADAGAIKPFERSLFDRIVSSWITMVVLALLAAAVVAFLIVGIFAPRRSGLPERMAEFVSIRALQQEGGPPVTAEVADDEQPENTYWSRLAEKLEIADINLTPQLLVGGTVGVTALVFLLIWAGTGSPWWALLALALPFFAREWVIRMLAHRRKKFAEQLPDALQVVASALRTGHSFAGALAVVVDSAAEPMRSEMQRVVADEQHGVPVQTSLMVVAERMASRDLEQLAMVSELQRESGGNAAEVIDRVAETVRERFDLKRLVDTLTMQGRMTRWIVSALPILIVLVLQVENPHYLHPLIASTAGKIGLGLAIAWAVAGSLVIKKIIEIEV